MKKANENPEVRVPEEPEDERPIGTGEDTKPELNGLAADPYADDILAGLTGARSSRLWLAGIIAVIILVLLVLVVVLVRVSP